MEHDTASYDAATTPLVAGKYVLYLGRRDTGKNTDLLIREFDRFAARTGAALKLVLAGPAPLPCAPQSKNIIDMGLVSNGDKANLLKYCAAVVNPSVNESYSRILFEAWFCGRPVVVNAACSATYHAWMDSGKTGWAADELRSFGRIFEEIDAAPPEMLRQLGERGLAYAKEVADWDVVIGTYIDFVGEMVKAPRRAAPVPQSRVGGAEGGAVLLVYTHIGPGDAVGHDMMGEYEALRGEGITAYVFAGSHDPWCDARYPGMCITEEDFVRVAAEGSSLVVYHHANYWPKGEELLRKVACPKWMKYHNVTPGGFFHRYADTAALGAWGDKGREQTARLVKEAGFVRYLPDSPHNGDELLALGANRKDIQVAAPMTKLQDFGKTVLDRGLVERYSARDEVKVLFVGRMAPNKGHAHIISVAERYLALYDRKVKFLFAGGDIIPNSHYSQHLSQLVGEKGLEGVVEFVRHVSFEQLHSLYELSDVFMLLSEHEGFCVPILEAQQHGLPVIALDRCAVRDTLGEGQVLFNELDYDQIASAVWVVGHNASAKRFLRNKGWENLARFDGELLRRQFVAMVNEGRST